MSKLTWQNAARALAWCVGLCIVTMFGIVLAAVICGYVEYSKPAPQITVVKYVDRPAKPEVGARSAENSE